VKTSSSGQWAPTKKALWQARDGLSIEHTNKLVRRDGSPYYRASKDLESNNYWATRFEKRKKMWCDGPCRYKNQKASSVFLGASDFELVHTSHHTLLSSISSQSCKPQTHFLKKLCSEHARTILRTPLRYSSPHLTETDEHPTPRAPSPKSRCLITNHPIRNYINTRIYA
jgi:hypothetical protein